MISEAIKKDDLATDLSSLCEAFSVLPVLLQSKGHSETIYVDVPATVRRITKEYYRSIEDGKLVWSGNYRWEKYNEGDDAEELV